MAVIIDPLAVDLKLGLGEHQPDGLPADFARPVVVRAMSVPRRLMTMTSGLPALDLPGLEHADLARSPFQGEGHRKVHARLWILDGIRVTRTRVLRVMRAQRLLSPHRGRHGPAKVHDGTIITSGPNVMERALGARRCRLSVGTTGVEFRDRSHLSGKSRYIPDQNF